MAQTTTEIIDMICPALGADASLQSWITLAEGSTSSCFFGSQYTLAVALRACHGYTLSKRKTGEAGPVASKKMGPVSISFAATASGNSLDSTSFGQELKGLIKSAGPGASVLGAAGRLCD